MTKRPYKRKPGDLEIRILRDGRVIFVAPDEAILGMARELERDPLHRTRKEPEKNGRTETAG